MVLAKELYAGYNSQIFTNFIVSDFCQKRCANHVSKTTLYKLYKANRFWKALAFNSRQLILTSFQVEEKEACKADCFKKILYKTKTGFEYKAYC